MFRTEKYIEFGYIYDIYMNCTMNLSPVMLCVLDLIHVNGVVIVK